MDERPFRFGVQLSAATNVKEWADKARRAEANGYDIALMPDHLHKQWAIGPGLTAAALATTRLRIGTLVCQNDLRHPAILAKEATTLDLVSDGRFELGIGAGGSWMPDFDETGIPFDSPKIRVDRLIESITIFKQLMAGKTVTFDGDHYHITGFTSFPQPVQQPHPPLMIGGGGLRMLRLAAREANTIGLLPRMVATGGEFQMEQITSAAVARQVEIVRQEAGERFSEIELNILLQRLIVTDRPREACEELSNEWTPLTADQLADTPSLLIGSIDQIVEMLIERRRKLGISYLVIFERDAEVFAPVVARLAGR